MQKISKHTSALLSAPHPLAGILSTALVALLALLPGLKPAFAQAPNITYSSPLVITQGGTYSGNYRSTNSSVPVITIQTTQPVIIENCVLAGAGDIIDAKNGGSSITVRNNKAYGLTQSADGVRHGRFVEVNSAKSVVIEHNYLEQTTGIAIYQWSGNGSTAQTLTVRYNSAKNIDGRFRNNSGSEFSNFLGADKVPNLANVEVAWNQVINEPNQSLVEDNINFYNSGGTAASPVRIHDNYVQGAYPYPANGSDFTGTGMIIDGTQSNTQGFFESYNNQFVSTCNSAMNIAGGHDVHYYDNRLVTSGLMPDGSRLNATYTGVAVFDYYGQSGTFTNQSVTNNTIGYVQWGRNSPFQDRQDEGDYGFRIATGTIHLPNPITLQTERDEFTRWNQKLQQNGITLDPGATTPTTPTAPTAPSAPTVSLSAPSTGTVGTALNLTATAAAVNGTITKVEFFSGATKLGEDLTAPYALSFTPAAAGTLSLTARATNNAGAATSTAVSSVTVTAATTTTPTTTGTGTTPTNATFVRAINVGGTATTVDGLSWEDGNSAGNFQINGSPFANQGVALNPATDAARAAMIRASVYDTNISAAVSGVASGTYSVYLYMWEDNNPVTLDITLEGQTVQSNYSSGNGGHWDRLGPFTANITDGTINIGTVSSNNNNLSGIEIWKQNAGTTAPSAPTVSLSAPSTGTVGTALNLTATAAAVNGTITKVEFFSGATKLGEDLTAPYALSFTPAAAGTLSLTARATNNAGAATSTAVSSVTVTAATTTTPTTTGTGTTPTNATFVRAINVGGTATTVDGLSWEDGNSAGNFQINGSPFANQGVALNPATDAARAAMIRASVYDTNISAAVSGVASGTYSVYLYMWEDNNPVTLDITLEGQTVQSNYSSGNGGHWDRLGPFTANITDGTINIGTVSSNNNNLSGIEIWKQNAGTTAPSAPTVSLSAPSTGTVGTALNLTATAAAVNGTITKVEFFSGATKLGEDLTAPYALSFTPAAAGTLSLTARATNNAGAATSTAVSSVTVTAATTTTPTTTGTGTTPTNATFVRAINVGGTATTVDGLSWEDGNSAGNFQINGSPFANQGVALNPATDAARAAMIRASVYDTNISAAVSGVASGTYSVYLYMWEDNNPVTLDITLEGQTVQSNYSSGNGGHWDRLGPFTANITDGTINIGTVSSNNNNLSGIEIWKQNAGTTAPSAPTVSLSAPSTGTVGTALNLTATAAAVNGTITKVEFFSGATKLGESLTAPYALSFTPAAAGTLSLTARATNNAGAATSTAVSSVTVTAATTTTPPTTTPPTFVRAVNLGGKAITLDGKSWAASASASNFKATGLTTFANQNVTLTPSTDATRASMIRASMYGGDTGLALGGVSSGTYSVFLYVWEDNNAENFSISLEGKTVLSNYNSGSAGHWDRLGPFTANVTDGTVNIGTTGGMANISGIELWKQATPLP